MRREGRSGEITEVQVAGPVTDGMLTKKLVKGSSRYRELQVSFVNHPNMN